MADKYEKYVQLTFHLIFTFVGFIVALIVLLLGLRLLFGILDQIPVLVYIYMLTIILVPAAVFVTVFMIFIKRSIRFPKVVIKWISLLLFAAALLAWAIVLVLDVGTFFRTNNREIAAFYSYDVIFLSLNVATIFLVGVMQALAADKEKDWMEKRRETELNV